MRPTFIACCARSGSTLLRWLLDSHPKVSCPSETDLALTVAAYQRSTEALWGPDAPTVHARRAAEELIDRHLKERGKSVFCDKSMSNALNLDLLARTWLSGHFVFLHRHVMDFIASAIDAQPFGLTQYGFDRFAALHPGDDVAALARYWLERTAQMLAFESRTGHRTVRIRYEDLVRVPGETLSPVWTLLGVEPPETDPDEALSSPHDATGCADHLIWYTGRVHDASLGTGARIPPQSIRGQLRHEVNQALSELGYDLIDDGWGAAGPLEDGVVRIVRRHHCVVERHTSLPGTIVVDQVAAPLVISQRINLGAAMRARDIRLYGRPLSGYGEERKVMSQLPSILTEMI